MADPCAYARCTAALGPSTHVLDIPDEPAYRFCSLTCCWSWLREAVDAKASPAASVEAPAASLVTPPPDLPVSTMSAAEDGSRPPIGDDPWPLPIPPPRTRQVFSAQTARVLTDTPDAPTDAVHRARRATTELNAALAEAADAGVRLTVAVVHDRVARQAPTVLLGDG